MFLSVVAGQGGVKVSGAPGTLSLSAGSPAKTVINLSWSAPSDTGGGTISGYRIKKDGSVLVADTSSTGTTYSATGLSADTEYNFTVAAINEAGTGADGNTPALTTAANLTATGGTITTYSGYKVHTFTSSGTFAISANPASDTVEVMVVAGGGSGGGNGMGTGATNWASAGSGAGGGSVVLTTTTSGSHTVTIGGGGAGGSSESGAWGSDSVFGSTTAPRGIIGRGSADGGIAGNNAGTAWEGSPGSGGPAASVEHPLSDNTGSGGAGGSNGYAGGNGGIHNAANESWAAGAGGGGGCGGAGGNGSGSSAASTGGSGGAGAGNVYRTGRTQ